MRQTIYFLVLAVFLLTVTISCSGGSGETSNPVTPPEPDEALNGASTDSSHYLLSFQFVRIDPETNDFEVTSGRQVSVHFNALKFLEQNPCADCVKILKIKDSGFGTKLVDIEITHPFASPSLTVFDVRGIVIFRGSGVFPSLGLNLSDSSLYDSQLVGADGFTSLYCPGTELLDPTGLQSYVKGKFATNQPPNAKVNGYKRFMTNGPANTRSAFYAGDKIVKTYEMILQGSPFVFGYAVDMSWAKPTKEPVTDPMTDFPPEANCPEPRRIIAYGNGYGLTDEGGETTLIIDVFDYQGKDSHFAPIIECPDLFDGTLTMSFVYEVDTFTQYETLVQNEKLASDGSYKCLIRVEDKANKTAPAWLDLSAYLVHTFNVTHVSEPGDPNLIFETEYIANSVSTSSDGSRIAVGSVWEVYFLNGNGELLWGYPTDSSIVDVTIMSDAARITAASSDTWDGKVYVLTKDGELLGSYGQPTSSVAYSPDTKSEGMYFVQTYNYHWLGLFDAVALWDENAGSWLWYAGIGRVGTGAAAVSQNGDYVAAGAAQDLWGGGGKVYFYSKAPNLEWAYKIDTTSVGSRYSIAMSSDGKYVVVGNEDNSNLYLFDRDKSDGPLWSYPTGRITGVSISGDGNLIVASIANKVYLFDRDKNLQLTSSIDNLEDVAISADGNKIIAVASNKVYSLLVDAPEEKFHFPVGYPDAEWYEHESPNGQGWMTYNPEPPCYGYHLGDDWNAKPPPDYDDYGDPVYAVI